MILFLVRISLTSLDMLVKAPGWMSWMMLLEALTESSLGWELSTRGVSLSEMKQNVRISCFCSQFYNVMDQKYAGFLLPVLVAIVLFEVSWSREHKI